MMRITWRGFGALLWLVLLAPVVALVPAALLDRGPGGNVRSSLFPAALGVLDPYLWDCARNSLAVSAVVTLGSLVLGVRLARLVVGRRFRGRRPLAALVFAPMVLPPLFGALGLRIAFGPSGPWRPVWERFCAGAHVDPHWDGWLAWVWVGLAGGVPLVAFTTAHALARVEPVWDDAARLAGASRRQVWRRIVGPLARPAAARGAAAVFTLTLFEPGAPLVLGLRRTLAFQAVEAALGPDSAPRAAVLALTALGGALIGRALLGWWGGEPSPALADGPVARSPDAGILRAWWDRLVLGAGGALAWLPVLSVIGAALTPPPSDSAGGMRLTLAPFAASFRDPALQRVALNSLGLGVAVVLLDLFLARSLIAWGAPRRAWVKSFGDWPALVPPLALGVGALALPGLLQMGADGARAAPGLARGLQFLADVLDPYRTPGLLLVLAVAALRAPVVAGAAERARGRARPVLAEAALHLGATRAQAQALAAGRRLGVALLTLALAATNLAPALLLGPTAEDQTLAPAVLRLADGPGDDFQRAAVAATCAVGVILTAFASSWRRLEGRFTG